MIRRVHITEDLMALIELIKQIQDIDFYYTENNQRMFINDSIQLKKLLKVAPLAYVYEEEGDVTGLIIIWTSLGNEIKRYYLKIVSGNEEVAKKLIKIVIWNWDKELYAKINKKNRYLQLLKSHGFQFVGDRGREILIKRDKMTREIVNKDTENDIDGHTSISKIFTK